MSVAVGTTGGSCDHQSEQPIGSLGRGEVFQGFTKITQENLIDKLVTVTCPSSHSNSNVLLT